MKCYSINARARGINYVEDPKCPVSWRGSGCYDIPVTGWQEITLDVYATTRANAENLAEEFCYKNAQFQEVEDVEILSVIVLDEHADDGEEEITDVVYGDSEWPEDTEPDYDDYEEQLIRKANGY